jgi:hypothetical protein
MPESERTIAIHKSQIAGGVLTRTMTRNPLVWGADRFNKRGRTSGGCGITFVGGDGDGGRRRLCKCGRSRSEVILACGFALKRRRSATRSNSQRALETHGGTAPPEKSLPRHSIPTCSVLA